MRTNAKEIEGIGKKNNLNKKKKMNERENNNLSI
jgi:hypothetical protein